MKLIRYEKNNKIYPGRFEAGNIYSLHEYIDDISCINLNKQKLLKIAKIKSSYLPIVSHYDRIAPCVGKVGKIICIGLNYIDHIVETNSNIPKEPVIFSKLCFPTGAYDNVTLPKSSKYTDWEDKMTLFLLFLEAFAYLGLYTKYHQYTHVNCIYYQLQIYLDIFYYFFRILLIS
jgi:ureidoglycolate lyase